ncbi:hypothetical protein L484_018251 [Morus notabilis]|uniref:EXPERA domain-containing protein n=1 Tax=Morus notabilis TaxID=981085 RepID=W9SAL4_9ROSA|nr:hypothetical protein L484_018251 [Morus notabilis]
MGALVKLIDVILFVFFVVIVLGAPLLDAQACLPESLFPDFLVELNAWYAHKFGDYLVAEKPHFFVGLVWLELFFQWPLAVLNLYGIWAAKSWLSTTCLIYGASVLTSLLRGVQALPIKLPSVGENLKQQDVAKSGSKVDVAILSEMIGSGKASDKLLTVYFPFLGLGVLAILRGLLAQSGKTASSSTVAEGSSLGRKKRA